MTAPAYGHMAMFTGEWSPAKAIGDLSICTDSVDGSDRSPGLRGLLLPGPCLGALLRSCLSPTDRLHIFQANRTLAAAVLQHAYLACEAQVEDALLHTRQVQGKQQITPDQAATGRATYGVTLTLDVGWEQGASQQQLKARWLALQGLLSTAPGADLQVVLRHGITSLWARLPVYQVTRLTLDELSLPAGLEAMLPLQQCSKLRTLCLRGVGWDQQQGIRPSTLSAQQRAALLAPALDHLEIYGPKAWGGLDAWAQLLGRQIRRLDFKLSCRPQPLADHAQLLRSAPLLTGLTHFNTDCALTDLLLDDLAAVTTLTHVTAAGMRLYRSHHSQHLQWQQLVLEGVLRGAEHVQLQPIKRVILRRFVIPLSVEDADELAGQLSSHPCPHCEDQSQSTFLISGQYSAALVSACAKTLTQGTKVLALDVTAQPPAGLLPAISSLPPNVMCLRLTYSPSMSPCAGQVEQFLRQVAGALPLHMERLNLVMPACAHTGCAWVAAVLSALTTVERHVLVQVNHWLSGTVQPHGPVHQLIKEHPTLLAHMWSKDRKICRCIWQAGKCSIACKAQHASLYASALQRFVEDCPEYHML